MRPLSPLPIAVTSAVLAAILWSFDALDDVVGSALVVWLSQMLVWIGVRGSPSEPADPGARAALALGAAMPTAACALAIVPWLAGGDGMEALGRVVGMMIFGVPSCVAVAAFVVWRTSDRPRNAALARTLAITASTTALAWALVLAWIAVHDGGGDVTTLLAFPALATWWLLLPSAELLSQRRVAA